MKKLISIVMIAAMIMSFGLMSGCNYMGENTSADSNAVSNDGAESPDSADSGFEDFVKYMDEGGFIKGKGESLTASVIGASYGERYTISSSGSKIYVELYVYKDTESKLAKNILGNAKDKGTFSLYKDMSTENTTAAVSADGKYLMLYTDSSTNGNNIQTKNDAVEAVKSYGK